MPDNVAVNTGSGLPVATDEILSALTGTVTKTASSATVAGVGTAFLSELSVGMVISIPGTAVERGIITAIASDASLTCAANFANTASGQTASRVLHYQLIKLVLGAMDTNSGPVAVGNPLPVAGNVASGSADSGNPVKVGGVYNTTPPTLTNGQRGDMQLAADGSQRISPANSAPTWTNIGTNNTDGVLVTDVSNFRWGTLNLSGTWSATIAVQISGDGGTTWPNLPIKNAAPASAGGFLSTTMTANGNYFFAIPGGGQLRIRTTSYSSGSVVGAVLLSDFVSSDLMPIIAISSGAGVGDSASAAQGVINYAGNATILATAISVWNGGSNDRQRGVGALTLLASAARTTTTNSADQTNYNWHGLLLTVDVTSAGTGSITPSIQVKDSISGNYKTIWTAAAALTTNGTYVYALAPNSASAASYTEIAQLLIGRTWRLAMTANNANSVTYSASADMVL